MEGTDRRGLLGDVARTISESATDIQHADMRASDGGMTAAFVIEVQDLSHLKRVMQAVQRVKGRALGGASRELSGERPAEMMRPPGDAVMSRCRDALAWSPTGAADA